MSRDRLTSREIAALCGVSQTTVSRVLRGERYVRPEIRVKVLAALHATGYVPNAAAQTMRTRESGAIGVIAGRITNPFYPQLLDALSAALTDTGRSMSLWIADDGGELSALTGIRAGLVDGLIYTTVADASPSLKLALENGYPIVLVNRTVPNVDVNTVTADNFEAAANVARYFVVNRRSAPALIGGPQYISTTRNREAGFLHGLKRAGMDLNSRNVTFPGYGYRQGRSGLEALFRGNPSTDAVFCVNDVLACGAIDAARDMGLRVPEDLWVVGCDDIEMGTWSGYSLTTVRQPITAMAELAVRIVAETPQNPGNAELEHREVQSELVVRNSTALVAA